MSKRFNYIIGDIHGCFEELLELEEKINTHAKENNAESFIISCGDLIDRGFYSKQIIEHFIKGQKDNTHTAIIGNHEVMMLQAIASFSPNALPEQYPIYLDSYESNYDYNKMFFFDTSLTHYKKIMKDNWLHHGGKETLESFSINPEDTTTWIIADEIMRFLIKLPIYYQSENFFVTHALGENTDLQRVLSYTEKYSDKFESFDRDYHKLLKDLFFNDLISQDDFTELVTSVSSFIWSNMLPKEKVHDKLHISGHTALKEVRYTDQSYTLQIDTGCIFGNQLTAYCPETNIFLSVKAKKAYKTKNLK